MPRIAGQSPVIQQQPPQHSGPLGIGSLIGAISALLGFPLPPEYIGGLSFVEALLSGQSVPQAVQYTSSIMNQGNEEQPQQTNSSEKKSEKKKDSKEKSADWAGGVKPGEQQDVGNPQQVQFPPPMATYYPIYPFYFGV